MLYHPSLHMHHSFRIPSTARTNLEHTAYIAQHSLQIHTSRRKRLIAHDHDHDHQISQGLPDLPHPLIALCMYIHAVLYVLHNLTDVNIA
ncbi:hypothetical protein K439DRAFT_1630742 [Ramaria rubella]|nr:hypothetical protein K439DRAFT_1630742 [Ramaria rubella]